MDKKIMAVKADEIIEARYSLSKRQNEILDIFLSELADDNKYSYEIPLDKYKELYDTDTSNLYRDMKKAVKGFEGEGFYVVNKDTDEEDYYPWFSKISYKNKLGKIVVNIDNDLKKMLLASKKKIKYNIKYTLNFNSVYTQRFYMYYKSFEDTGWRIDNIETLMTKLECPKSYSNFANFKKYVLDVVDRELNSNKSDIGFHYEIIKTGKKVTHISVKIFQNQIQGEMLIEHDYKKLSVGVIRQLTENRVSVADCEKILNIYLKNNVEDEVAHFKDKLNITDDYITKNKKEDVPLIALLITSIKNDWVKKKPIKPTKTCSNTNSKVKQLKFNNFDAREMYNDKEAMDELTDALTSWGENKDEVAVTKED